MNNKDDDPDENIQKQIENFEEIFEYIDEEDLIIMTSSIRKTIKTLMFELEKPEEEVIQFIVNLTYNSLADISNELESNEHDEHTCEDCKEKNKNNIN